MTGQLLDRLSQDQLHDQYLLGFFFTPGGDYDDGIAEGTCPQLLGSCICRLLLLCTAEFEEPLDDYPPLQWTCSCCGLRVAATNTWGGIIGKHISHICHLPRRPQEAQG